MPAFRRVCESEIRQLMADGETVEWDEGCGWVVYDAMARELFIARCSALTPPTETGETK